MFEFVLTMISLGAVLLLVSKRGWATPPRRDAEAISLHLPAQEELDLPIAA